MNTIEDLQNGPELEVQQIPVDAIEPDPENPNEMTDELMAALSEEIDRGFTQPVLLRALGEGRYRMVDGEHRWRLIRDKGYATIPSVVEDYGDGDEAGDLARIRLLTMNRLRGNFVPIKMAYMLADLAQRIPEAELRKRLGMDEREMKDSLQLANFTDPLVEKLKEARKAEERDAPAVLSFVVPKADAPFVEQIITDTAEAQDTDRGGALVYLCREADK